MTRHFKCDFSFLVYLSKPLYPVLSTASASTPGSTPAPVNRGELDWDMEFNPSKCVVIHITRSRTPVPSQYLLHGQVLESVAGSKYLGVEISSNLSFNGHIQNITTSASRSLGFLKRNIRSRNGF